MKLEEYYKTSTEGYLAFLDLLIETAKEDPDLLENIAELAFLLAHRKFVAELLESLVEEINNGMANPSST